MSLKAEDFAVLPFSEYDKIERVLIPPEPSR
jgi:hypothetical protein